MATVQMVLNAERWRQEILLAGVSTDNGGSDFGDSLVLPSGIGDVAIIEMQVLIGQIATKVAETNLAIRADVVSGGGLTVDIIGTAKWWSTGAVRSAAYFSPDPLVLWRQGEVIGITSAELDSNASPTADVYYYVKCIRVPVEVPQEQPRGRIKLVR